MVNIENNTIFTKKGLTILFLILLAIWLGFFFFINNNSTKIEQIEIAHSSVLLEPGQIFYLQTNVLPADSSNQELQYIISDPTIAAVNEAGLITALQSGTTKITIKDPNTNILTTCDLVIADNPDIAKDIVVPSEMNIAINSKHLLTINLNPSTAKIPNLTYTSSDSNIVSVDREGYITGNNNGVANITIEGNNGVTTLTKTIRVTVGPTTTNNNNNPEVTNITLDKTTLFLKINDEYQLTAIIEPIGIQTQIEWKSSNSDVATVDNSGKIMAYKNGKTTISATTSNNKVATCVITVENNQSPNNTFINVTDIKLDKNNLQLSVGNTSNLIATIIPSNATNKELIWQSDNNSVISVNNNGTIKALKSGTATITVTTKDGSKNTKCFVTAKNDPAQPIKVTSVSLDKNNLQMSIGSTANLTAVVLPNNATNKEVTWQSDNSGVVSVTNNGIVKALKSGTATITVTTKDGSKSAHCTIDVKNTTSQTINVTNVYINRDSLTLNVGDKSSLVATISPSDATNKGLTWTSNNPSVATVDGSGLVTALKAGTAIITVTTKEGNKQDTCTVNVEIKSTGTKIIFMGDSRVVRLAGNEGRYKIDYHNRNVVFVAKGGTEYVDWFKSSSSYMNKVNNYVNQLNGSGCAIIVGLGGNDLAAVTASSASAGRQKIVNITNNYINGLVIMANKYANLCTVYFTSVNPVQLNKKVTVYAYDSSKALTASGRSNAKIETFNNSIKNLIINTNISNLKYVDTSSYFVESKDKLKNGYTTSDGTHYNERTTQKVYDKIIELTGL